MRDPTLERRRRAAARSRERARKTGAAPVHLHKRGPCAHCGWPEWVAADTGPSRCVRCQQPDRPERDNG